MIRCSVLLLIFSGTFLGLFAQDRIRDRSYAEARDRSQRPDTLTDGYPLNVNPEYVSADEAPVEDADLVMV